VLKPFVKDALGRAVSAAHLHTLLLRRSAVVVAFHRVQDIDDPTGLTVDRATFERHCRFFRRHFNVVPLTELIGRLERGHPLNRHLAITFDDGYRDNFDNARPILQKLGLPATFFVVSGWMGGDEWPWWDRERNVRHPWMTWRQVRELSRDGFDVGAHTRTHVDLGVVSVDVAREEIAGARADLEDRLERNIDLFAYPYGRPANLSEANRAIVRDSGFRCCCSCHGGLTPADTDPFRLQRIAMSRWFESPQQFGLELVRESLAA